MLKGNIKLTTQLKKRPCNVDYGLALDKIISYQVMLLLITAIFSQCFGVTSSCKGTITKRESKKVRLQNLGDYEIHNSQVGP